MRKRLRQIRLSRGISQTFLAEKLGYRHSSGYANIEYGRNNLTLEKALIIADVLGVDVTALKENEENFFDENLHEMSKTKKTA